MAKKNDKVDISKTPTVAVTGLATPKKKRSGNYALFTAEWKYPKTCFDEKREDRFQGVLVKWVFDKDVMSKVKKATKTVTVKNVVKENKKDVVKKVKYSGIGYLSGIGKKTSSSKVYKLVGSNATKHTYKLNRKSFYPFGSQNPHTDVKMYVAIEYKKVKTAVKGRPKTYKTSWKVLESRYAGRMELSKARLLCEYSELMLSRYKTTTSLTPAQVKKYGKLVDTVGLNDYAPRKSFLEGSRFLPGASDKVRENMGSSLCFFAGFSGKHIVKVPYTRKYLSGIGVLVQGWNSKTKVNKKKKPVWSNTTKTQAAYFDLKPPNPPKITYKVAGEASNHTITFTLESEDDGTISKERYDTYYTLTKEWRFGTAVKSKIHKAVITKKANAALKFDVSRNPNLDVASNSYRSILGLKVDEYVKYTLTAYNRGLSGDSKTVSKSFMYARPHWVTIQSITLKGTHYQILFNVQNYVEGAKNSKKLQAAHPTKRYTTKFTLQRLANFRPSGSGYGTNVDDWSDAQWLAAARSQPSNSWTNVYTIGAGERVFLDQKFLASFEPFRRTYYRIMPENDIYGMEGTASPPKVIAGFIKIPNASSEKTMILDVENMGDGESLVATVAFHKTATRATVNGQTFTYANSNGLELSWDTYEHAWASTQAPSSHDFKDDTLAPWKTYTTDKSGTITGLASLAQKKKLKPSQVYNSKKKLVKECYNLYRQYYIRGLEASKSYYVKARRFLKDSGTRESDSYGKWAHWNTPVTVSKKITGLKATGPATLVWGHDLSISWTYDDEDQNEQVAYQLAFCGGGNEGGTYYYFDPRINPPEGYKYKSVYDTSPYAVIPWSKVCWMENETQKSYIFEGVVYVAVQVKTVAGWSSFSNAVAVRVIKPPTARIGSVAAITKRDQEFTLYSTSDTASAIVRVIAPQISNWGPMGADVMPDGTIVHSNKIDNIPWKDNAQVNLDGVNFYYYVYKLPETTDIRDGYRYTIEYTAIEDETGLRSDVVDDEGNVIPATLEVDANLSDNVPQPNAYVVIDETDQFNHMFTAHITVRIDRTIINQRYALEIYRVTPDKVYEIFSETLEQLEIPQDKTSLTVVDPFPAYSQYTPSRYRVAWRSPNGRVEWRDCIYNCHGYAIRFDWGSPEDEKNGVYTHVTLPYNIKWSDSWAKNSRIELHMDGQYSGYWREGVDHKSTMSTELVKMSGAEQLERVRALANYAGPVLVRLPNGSNFCANVDVNNLDTNYDSLVVTASFAAQEISMSEEFKIDRSSAASGAYVPQS